MDREPRKQDPPHEVGAVKQEELPRKLRPSGGGGGGDRFKRDEWSEGAVSSLLEAYETKWVLRNRAKLKGQDWEDVARFVSSRANSTKTPKTQAQCKNKIESMKKRYRSESSSSAAAADASSSWPLYHRLDHLLRGNTGAAAAASSTAPPRQHHQHRHLPPHPPPLLLLEPSPAVQTVLPAVQVVQPQPATQPPLPIPSLLVAPPAVPPPSPSPLPGAQNSHGSTGVDGVSGKKADGARGAGQSSADHDVPDRKNNMNAADTDSSTPALVYSDQKEDDKFGKAKRMKMKRKSAATAVAGSRRRSSSSSAEWEVAESIRWLAEVVVRSEQTRMETMRELEKMRIEAEAKRGEMDLKRTEIVANTQLEIAKLFAGLIKGGGPVDSSLRIGRN